jgi:uncharacterized membrane protein
MMEGGLLLLGLALVIGLFLGPIGFFLTLGLRGRLAAVEGLRGQVTRLEAELAALAVARRETPAGEPHAADLEGAVAPSSPTPPDFDAPRETPLSSSAAPPPLPSTSPEASFGPAPLQPEGMPIPLPAPAPRIGIEERLGAHWAVVVGGIALALGALLLVKYSIESGLFGPGPRVVAGLLVGFGLVAAGEILRRRERPAEGALQGAPIPAVLTGAGTVAAFGSLYAAHALYGFIGPGPAFILMGALGVATMFAAALHGPALAGLGLVGALGAPLLVTSAAPNPWPVVLFVAVVTAAAYGLARLRRWLWLAIAAALGAALWQALFLADLSRFDFILASFTHLVVETALLLAAFAWAPHFETAPAEQRTDKVATIVALAAAAMAALVLAEASLSNGYGPGWIAAASLVAAMLALTGSRLPALAGASAGAGLLILAALATWGPNTGRGIDLSVPFSLEIWPTPKNVDQFAGFGVAASLALGALCVRRLLDPAPLSFVKSAIYAGAGVMTPLGALSIAYLRLSDFRADTTLAAAAGVAAFALTGVATLFRQRADASAPPAITLGLGAAATGALAALALGLVFALSQGTLTVALALAALAAAYVAERLAIPALRWATMGLGLAVAGRLGYDPRIVGDELGRTIVLNWLLFGYGAPALAFGLAARLMAPVGRRCAAARDAGAGDPVQRLACGVRNPPRDERRRPLCAHQQHGRAGTPFDRRRALLRRLDGARRPRGRRLALSIRLAGVLGARFGSNPRRPDAVAESLFLRRAHRGRLAVQWPDPRLCLARPRDLRARSPRSPSSARMAALGRRRGCDHSSFRIRQSRTAATISGPTTHRLIRLHRTR